MREESRREEREKMARERKGEIDRYSERMCMFGG